MRGLTLALGVAAALVVGLGVAMAQVPKTEAERNAAIQSLGWREGQSLDLPISHGTLRAPRNVRELVGSDAVTLYQALNGVEAPSGMEAALYDDHARTLLFYQKIGGGFVRLDDWDDVDGDAILKSVSENTEADNRKRKEAGLAGVHVVGWLERPHLDQETHTVRWAFEARDDLSNSLVNSVALVLGRDGFEKLTWVGSKSAFNDGLLNVGLGGFSFPAGGRYADYKDGDKVAEYGIAGLVAAVLGAKVAAKVGLFAALAILLKKFGAFIVVGGGAILTWFLRSLGRGRQQPSSSKEAPPAS